MPIHTSKHTHTHTHTHWNTWPNDGRPNPLCHQLFEMHRRFCHHSTLHSSLHLAAMTNNWWSTIIIECYCNLCSEYANEAYVSSILTSSTNICKTSFLYTDLFRLGLVDINTATCTILLRYMTVLVKGNLLDFQDFWDDKMSVGGQ